jgi:Fe-S-cluster containining protein
MLMSKDRDNNNNLLRKPDPLSLSEEERTKILEVALERMVMIDNKVYGLEDETEPVADVDCKARIKSCRAICCTYLFALTQEETKQGIVKYNAERPFYIARDADGYCPHLDRTSFLCSIHEKRPLRCRKYACRQ